MFTAKEFRRFISQTAIRFRKVNAVNVKGKKLSSQLWLSRQLTDPYVEKAKMHNYRCRSAFKLIEMDDRHAILAPGQVVIDCGASPGSWTQVVVQRTNANGINQKQPKGISIAIDKQHIYPIEGATLLPGSDFTTQETQNRIIEALGERKANVVLSDMAPSATGIKEMDDENIINLCYQVLAFAVRVSALNASLIVKLWQCEQRKQLENNILRFYDSAKIAKPNASRADSAEIFLLAKKFKGLKS